MTPALVAIALAVAAAAGGSGGWKLASMRYEHLADLAQRKAAADVAAANQRATNAADDYEVWASLQRPRTVTVTREVEREIKSDADCSTRPLPAGLRDALTRASADADQPVADRSLPAASAPGVGDLGGLGARLLGSAGGTARLQSQTPGAR